MTTTPLPPQGVAIGGTGIATGFPAETPAKRRARLATSKLSSPWASLTAIFLAVLWTTPSLGLLVTSFRPSSAVSDTGWWTAFAHPEFTTANYQEALFGGSTPLINYFVNSIVITLPAVIIQISIAMLAAYGFAWIDFKGRNFLFVAVFAL